MTEFLLGVTRAFSHGRAFTEQAVVASPAAGAGFSYIVGNAYVERIAALSFTLTTGANAANRVVTLSVLDGNGNVIAKVPAAAAQTASLADRYTFLPNVTAASGPTAACFLSPMPDLFLYPEWSLAVAIAAVDAADQISAITLVRERIITGPGGYELGVVTEERARALAELRLTELT